MSGIKLEDNVAAKIPTRATRGGVQKPARIVELIETLGNGVRCLAIQDCLLLRRDVMATSLVNLPGASAWDDHVRPSDRSAVLE